MKTSFFLAAFCLITLSAFLIYAKFDTHGNRTSITITEDEDTYELEAIYNADNTGIVEQYINKSIAPNSLAGSVHDYFDASTSLPDHTQFHIKEYPGELKIVFDKRKNSTMSYLRIKRMCEGIKSLVSSH
jgi:hypothetical protein